MTEHHDTEIAGIQVDLVERAYGAWRRAETESERLLQCWLPLQAPTWIRPTSPTAPRWTVSTRQRTRWCPSAGQRASVLGRRRDLGRPEAHGRKRAAPGSRPRHRHRSVDGGGATSPL